MAGGLLRCGSLDYIRCAAAARMRRRAAGASLSARLQVPGLAVPYWQNVRDGVGLQRLLDLLGEVDGGDPRGAQARPSSPELLQGHVGEGRFLDRGALDDEEVAARGQLLDPRTPGGVAAHPQRERAEAEAVADRGLVMDEGHGV